MNKQNKMQSLDQKLNDSDINVWNKKSVWVPVCLCRLTCKGKV